MATAAKASQGIDFGSDAESDSGIDTGTLLGVIGGVGLRSEEHTSELQSQ